MQIVKLYKYENEDGSISISPELKEGASLPYKYRLIADEGKVLTDGENTFYCIDTDNVSKYSEIDKSTDESSVNIELNQKAEAFNYITGREN